MDQSQDFERSIEFGEIALRQIKTFKTAAIPHNYELWYTYATGYNAALTRAINDVVASKGELNNRDAEELYKSYLCPTRFSDRIDEVGSQVMEELDQLSSMIDMAAGQAASYGSELAQLTEGISKVQSRDQIKGLITRLVRATKDIETSNRQLETRLKESREEIINLQENLDAVRNESLTDPLTLLANRKAFDIALAKLMAEAARHGEPVSLLLTDIDHFKRFNDTYGHLTGDQVLRLVALALKQNVKGQDVAARYGGEEFAVILPTTGQRAATTVADHIRRAVMSKELIKRSTGEQLGRITISIGVATWRPGDTPTALIERADKFLYAAKRAGRNRVISETDPEANYDGSRAA